MLSVLGQDTEPLTGPGVLVSHGSRHHQCVNDCQSLCAEESDNVDVRIQCWMLMRLFFHVRFSPGQKELSLFRSEFSSGLEGGDAKKKKKKKKKKTIGPSGEEE